MKKKISISIFIGFILLIMILPTKNIVAVNLDNTFQGISLAHPLGTDNLGRDVYSLMVEGCIRTLIVVLISTIISMTCGVILGMISGYFGGHIETAIQFLADFTLIIPSFISALVFTAIFGLTPVSVGVVLGLTNMGEYIIQVTSLTKSMKKMEFIKAEIVLGIPDYKIICKHILPNISKPLLTFMGNRASSVTLQYASLAFIGLGTDVTNPDWGTMLYQYRVYIINEPMLVLWPTLGIFLLALFFHVVFDNNESDNSKDVSLYD